MHAGFELFRKQRAVLETDQFAAIVAERVFGFEVQMGFISRNLPGQRFFDLRQQVFAAL
jgi:hypothetical protein